MGGAEEPCLDEPGLLGLSSPPGSLLYHTWLVHGFSAESLVSISGFHLPALKGFQWLLWFCVLWLVCLLLVFSLHALFGFSSFSCIWDSLSRPLFPPYFFHASHIPCYHMWEVQTLRPSFQLSFWSLIAKPCLISHWISKFFFEQQHCETWVWIWVPMEHFEDLGSLFDTLLKQTFSISSCIWRWEVEQGMVLWGSVQPWHSVIWGPLSLCLTCRL